MKMKKLLTIMLTVILCMGAITACSQSKDTSTVNTKDDTSTKDLSNDTSDDEDKQNTIIIGETSNFVGGFASIYGPEQGNSMSYYYYICNFYESLVNYEHGKIKPGLAKEWKVSDDGLIYTFYLQEGIKFSDGTDLTADVVKLNFDNFKKVLGKSAINYGKLTSILNEVKVINDYEIELHLDKPYYATLTDLAMVMPRGIMAPAAYNEEGKLSDAVKIATYGTGPYMYNGDNDNDLSYTFVRNPYYNRKLPEIDEFTVKVIEDNASKSLALQNGEIDILVGTGNISYDIYDSLNKNEKFTGKVSDVNSLTEFLAFNSEKAPFDDVNVRQAITYGVDRDKIANVLFSGLKTPAGTIMDTNLPYCDISVTPYEYNVQKAKGILEKAGWIDTDGDGKREKNGIPLKAEIKYVTNTMNDKIMIAIKANLADIGVDITLNGMEQMAMFTDIYNAGDYEMSFYKSYGILYDPFTFVSNMNPNLDYNNGVYSTDPMVSKALSSMNYDEAYKLTSTLLSLVGDENITNAFHKALESAHRDTVIIPVTYQNELTVYNNSKIEDYTFGGNPSWIKISGINLK